MRIFKLLFFFFVLLFAACSSSNEDKAKEAFNRYVQLNFDDPSAISEIVSVSIDDTLTMPELKKMAKDIRHWKDSLETKTSDLADSINSLAMLYGRRLNQVSGFADSWNDYLYAYKECANNLISLLNKLNGDIKPLDVDSILQLDDQTIYQVSVKYRINEGSLKLKTVTGMSDDDFSNTVFTEREKQDKFRTYYRTLKTIEFYNDCIEEETKVLVKEHIVLSKIDELRK